MNRANRQWEELVDRAAKAAARVDVAEGGHRGLTNVLASLTWALTFRADHDRCGRLQVLKDDKGMVTGATCPRHGRSEAPEWKNPPPTTGDQ